MFEIGFGELLLVGLVALLVLGPERLPVAARMAGLWLGRLRRSFSSLRAEVEREIGADEIRRQLHNEQILDMERRMQLPQTSAASVVASATTEVKLSAPVSSPDKPAQP